MEKTPSIELMKKEFDNRVATNPIISYQLVLNHPEINWNIELLGKQQSYYISKCRFKFGSTPNRISRQLFRTMHKTNPHNHKKDIFQSLLNDWEVYKTLLLNKEQQEEDLNILEYDVLTTLKYVSLKRIFSTPELPWKYENLIYRIDINYEEYLEIIS